MIGDSRQDKIFGAVNVFLLVLLTLCIAYPLYFVIIASISEPTLVNSGKIWLFPQQLTWVSYEYVWNYSRIWQGYLQTILVTVVGTVCNLLFTMTAAFSLSRTRLPFMRGIMLMFTFTMYFGGGMIPTYLLVSKYLNLRNTIWALILPGAISTYNLILVRTYYMQSIPGELMEAAKLDGCSEIKTLWYVALPLSAPIIATMALFYGVGHWNEYFSALIYISDTSKYTLQLVLREILIVNESALTNSMEATTDVKTMVARAQMAETMKYAVIIVSSLPVMIAYPFAQKWFIKGMLLGSLKE